MSIKLNLGKILTGLICYLQMHGTCAFCQSPVAVAKKAQSSCVVVITSDQDYRLSSIGSGFFIKNDTIVTCFHVIDGAVEVFIKSGSGNLYRVKGIVAYDRKVDLCILKIAPTKIDSLEIANVNPEVGERAYAYGNPDGLEGSFTDGTVSAIRNSDDPVRVQFTAPVDPGSSGGPLLNSDGKVMGIVSSKVKGANSFNFAISVQYIALMNIANGIKMKSIFQLHKDMYGFKGSGPNLGLSLQSDEGDYMNSLMSIRDRKRLSGFKDFNFNVGGPFSSILDRHDSEIDSTEKTIKNIKRGDELNEACAQRIVNKLKLIGVRCHMSSDGFVTNKGSGQLLIAANYMSTNSKNSSENELGQYDSELFDDKGNNVFDGYIQLNGSLLGYYYLFSGDKSGEKSIEAVANAFDRMIDGFIIDYLIANSDRLAGSE